MVTCCHTGNVCNVWDVLVEDSCQTYEIIIQVLCCHAIVGYQSYFCIGNCDFIFPTKFKSREIMIMKCTYFDFYNSNNNNKLKE